MSIRISLNIGCGGHQSEGGSVIEGGGHLVEGAGGAIDLDQLAPPEILDPHRVQGSIPVPRTFPERSSGGFVNDNELRDRGRCGCCGRLCRRMAEKKAKQKQGCGGVAVPRGAGGGKAAGCWDVVL